MKLLSRQSRALPGVTGVARVSRRTPTLLGRVGPRDIVVIDHQDIDRPTAEALVRAGVVAVVNAAPSISGRYPNAGPEILLAAGVLLVDEVGGGVFGRIKEGARLRVHEGTVYSGEDVVAEGIAQTPESVADLMIEARTGMGAQLEAFAANAIEFMKRERGLLLDGIGIPAVGVRMRGRPVVVVAASADTRAQLKSLKKYIAEDKPVLVGLDAGADALRTAGYTPDLIIGNPEHIDADTLRCGAEVVLPAHIDGHAPGLERLQDLGVGAVTFPASGTAEDLALLLVDAHEAALIVTVGLRATLTDLLDRGRGASNFLVRMRVANKLVDAPALATVYRPRISWWVVLLPVLAAAAAIVVALLVSDVSGAYWGLIVQWWNDLVDWVRGLFS
ncbi:putative cytokinetic ring protein SteA [Nakamurella leprariae]|uniref:Thiamine pyrophosphokinase n=1 Tax=Nakamurella leprariae TaxID=2803911 RepID=A0A938YGR7_9ACTN|nr:putative cytokinetic ring protein SteA [Nakamurella leprariae]MBM9469609.1 thiamine pyrophosphokinase [Nakamurella leprariae]